MTDQCVVTACGIELFVLFVVICAIYLLAVLVVLLLERRKCEKHGHALTEIGTVNGRYARICQCGYNWHYINFD